MKKMNIKIYKKKNIHKKNYTGRHTYEVIYK